MSQVVLPIAEPSQTITRFVATLPGRIAARLAVMGILLALWQFAPGKALRFWMSGPLEIVARLLSWIRDGALWEHLGATLTAMTLGYGIGTAVGISLGLVFGFLPKLHRVLSPY